MIDKQLMYWRSTNHPYIAVLKMPLALTNVFKEFALWEGGVQVCLCDSK